MSGKARNGENGESGKKNRQRVGENFNSKGFPLRVAILAKMAYLAKMANMEKHLPKS